MSLNIFTYGSLMFPQVWQRVVRGDYRNAPARLDGYARFGVAGETYPGVIEQVDASVGGVLYFDVTPADLAALDAFEGEAYRRVTVPVVLDSGEQVEGDTYVFLQPHKLLESAWLPENFQLESFLGTYCRDKLGE